ncbi:MAG TPA: phytanoyl-CoA dioxygenase family protein [Pirellulales bacterium]|jgi:ectoine hydroxylase-related dioxygenase (phytanoyl-CoA dioxygenase family)|nr:phytanoyl-CoA dioxygenase family protein [Pirellulales bacterium]
MTPASAALKPAHKPTLDLDSPYPLTRQQIQFCREQGYIKLKDVLSPAVIEHYGPVIDQRVRELNTLDLPMNERTTYQKAFLQIMNIWTRCPAVKELVFSKRLARLAAELMGSRGVRLYHDQALFKEAGGGVTPWHADQQYWPLATSKTITAWIPLQAVPIEMGPLAFGAGSHRFQAGRDLEISDESEQKLGELLNDRSKLIEEPFDLGEVSFHYGWTFHRAGVNTTPKMRGVITIIYFDEDTLVAEPKNKNQLNDLNTWLPDAKVGQVAATRLNPVLYTSPA